MTPADKYLAYLNAAANEPDAYKDYIWGDAGQDWDGDGGPEWDCSGLRIGALKAAGFTVLGRPTAEIFRSQAHPISAPSQIGDFRVHLNSDGSAKHIIQYVGNGKTIEAKGSAFGIVRDTVANGHGPWYRNDAVNAFLNKEAVVPKDTSWGFFVAHAGDTNINQYKDLAAKLGDAKSVAGVPQAAFEDTEHWARIMTAYYKNAALRKSLDAMVK